MSYFYFFIIHHCKQPFITAHFRSPLHILYMYITALFNKYWINVGGYRPGGYISLLLSNTHKLTFGKISHRVDIYIKTLRSNLSHLKIRTLKYFIIRLVNTFNLTTHSYRRWHASKLAHCSVNNGRVWYSYSSTCISLIY